jgi:hypothetical protein
MIKISADNQVTKKTPKHVDVWITTAFFSHRRNQTLKSKPALAKEEGIGL